MSKNGSLTKTSVAVNATAQRIIAGNSLRNYLLIENSGTGDIEFGFDSTLVVGAGVVLSPGGLGKQGGFLVWDGNFIPTNAIWVVSSAGSTVTILEGA